MYDYFDKHGKKFLAIVGSLLTLVFLLPAGFNGRGGGGGGQFGKINGSAINGSDVESTQNIMRSLDRLIVPNQTQDGQFSQMPITQAILGGNKNLSDSLHQNPVLAYLLMDEAAKAGAIPDDAALDPMLSAPVQYAGDDGKLIPMDQLNPKVKDVLREQLRRLVGVVDYFNRAEGAVKVSQPLVDDQVARQEQQIKARVAVFDAATYDSQVTTPTANELKRQFDAYANTLPAVTEANPFGFGYQVPDRATVQWLAVLDADVSKAVEATKSAELWEEDAIIYYQQHQSEYVKTVAPATQPTTQPFAAVKDDVLKALRSPLIEQKKRTVANRIAAALMADYQKASKTPTTQTATVSYGAAFGSFDYLQKLADDIQKQTGVRPTTVAPAGLLSEEELNKQPGFGQTILTDRAIGFSTGAQYLFNNLQPLHPKAQPSAVTLHEGQPTVVLEGTDGLYVARAVAVEPAHAAKSLDDVKAQVEKDVRRANAFKIAAEAAQAKLDQANKDGGLEKVGVAVQTSDWFGAESPTPAGLTGDYVAGLIGPAFETLRGLTSPAALPVRTLAKLRHEGKAAIIEVFDVKTSLNTADKAQIFAMAQRQVGQSLFDRKIVEQWFNFDAVSRRVNYVPDTPRDSNNGVPPTPNPANPASPLLPG